MHYGSWGLYTSTVTVVSSGPSIVVGLVVVSSKESVCSVCPELVLCILGLLFRPGKGHNLSPDLLKC